MLRSIRARLALTVLGTLGILICASLAGAQVDNAVIRVVTGPSDPSTAMVYADKMGYFKRAGLNVQLDKGATSSTMAAAVAGGAEDIGQASSLSAVLIIAKGVPLTIVANQTRYNAKKPDIALLVLKSSTIVSPSDLNDKTLSGVALQDLNSIATAMWLQQHGGDPSTLKFVEMPASATLAALQEHRIDAATVYEPFYSSMFSSGEVRVLGYPYSGIANRFSDSVLYARTDWTVEHRALLERFLSALEQANADVVAHESDAAVVMAQFAGLDPKTIASMHQPEWAVAIVPGDLQPVIDAVAKVKLIPKAFPASSIICSCALKR